MKIILYLCAWLYCATAWASNADVLTLELAEQAVLSHPAIQQSEQQARALAEVPAQVSSLPDPRVSLNVLNIPLSAPSLSREAMTQTQFGVSQALPYPGKLDLRAQAADFAAKAASESVAEVRLLLQRNIRMHWWNLLYLDHALETVSRNQTLLRQLVRIADSKYKTGQGLQSDVLLAQLELSKLLDSEITLKRARRNEEAIINSLLQRPADASITLPATVNEQLNRLPDIGVLHDRALKHRPWLNAQREQVSASEARVALAKKDYYPDFNIGANYGMRAGRSDLTGIMFSMNLPIFSDTKQDRALAQREAEREAAVFSLQDRILQIDSDLRQGLSDYESARKQALLFKTGIIPQAGQTVASMLAGYQVSKVDFLNLVQAQITHYNYETQYWQALSLAHQAMARLQATVGTSITESNHE
jgi:outer membrane protein TolC